VKRVYGHKVAIMEVLGMAGKLLRIISPDKIKNRDAEYYKQALDLSPGYGDQNPPPSTPKPTFQQYTPNMARPCL